MKPFSPKNEKFCFAGERDWLHRELQIRRILSLDSAGVASIADQTNRLSVSVAAGIVAQVFGTKWTAEDPVRPEIRADFDEACRDFLTRAFLRSSPLPSGKWRIDAAANCIELLEGPKSLLSLAWAAKTDSELAAVLAADYFVGADVLVSREIDQGLCAGTEPRVFPYASISTKWKLSGDRTLTPAPGTVNLARTATLHVPHVVVVTAEPMPTRIARLAFGNIGVDRIYHVFLYEIVRVFESLAKRATPNESGELLNTMIADGRLRDISDLPLDLAI